MTYLTTMPADLETAVDDLRRLRLAAEGRLFAARKGGASYTRAELAAMEMDAERQIASLDLAMGIIDGAKRITNVARSVIRSWPSSQLAGSVQKLDRAATAMKEYGL